MFGVCLVRTDSINSWFVSETHSLTYQLSRTRRSAMPDTRLKPGPRYEPLLNVLRSAEGLWEASRVFFARWELSPSQFNILNILESETEGVTQVELSRLLIMHRSNVTGLIDRLETRSLVERKTVVGDRRAHRVCLTEAGRNLLGEVLPVYYAAAEKVWGKISTKRAACIVGELGTLCTNAHRIAENNQENGKDGES